jgi:HK97 family phage portal protein
MKMPAILTRMGAAISGKSMTAVPTTGGGWFRVIGESFAGAFQSAVQVDAPRDILTYSGVFAPLTLITSDIAKLRVKLVAEDEATGIFTEVKRGSPFLPVLRRPNRYQNRIKFFQQWILSKLLYGNAYILKQRDARGIVVAMYVLSGERVTPLVTHQGDVYYKLEADHLSGLQTSITVPASEIIHDMMPALWHPLVGVSPLYAAGMSATMGRKIQGNSANFFANMSRPGGMLTAPNTIDDETALRLKTEFEQNFAGTKMGRLFVGGDGLKYEPMAIPAEAAQLIEQLKWTVEDVARCFHMPLFKVGGPVPTGHTIEALNLQYYTDCLQSLIEDAELALKEGLTLPAHLDVEFDIDGLARMDTAAQVATLNDSVKGGWLAPNEARAKRNLAPVAGGASPYLQQQNYSLAALAKRDAQDDPFGTARPPQPPPPPAPQGQDVDEDDETDKALHFLFRKSPEELTHA